MITLYLYCFICYAFMFGFLWDVPQHDKLDRILKTVSLTFAPIVLPFMVGKILNDNE